MANNLKGITIEFEGNTSKLLDAISDVNKRSRSLSRELGDINKLLKLDPGNTDLLSQKQKVLADAIENTGKKLKTLKEAEKQVQAQFEKGEVSEEQVRALQREIIATEKKMDGYSKAAKDTEKALRGVSDESKEVTEHSGKLGKALGNAAKVGMQAVAAAATAAVTGLIAAAESTREYRTEMGKLDTAFTTAGHTSEAATETYKSMVGVLGETDQAVEASNHLAQLCKNEEELATWTDIATGVYATFGASLPVENITEAANETAKTGAIVGGLADALNWAGVSEEEFQAKLDACSSEQERATLITETLNGLYSETAEKYRETNAEVIRANEANEAWMSSLAGVGGAIEPIITDVKMMGASLLSELVPGVQQLAESFRGLLNGDEGAAAGVGEALSGIITQVLTKLAELAPALVQAAMGLITSLTTTLISMLPQLITTGVQVIMAIIQGLTTAIPQVITAIVGMIPQLVNALVTGIPQLVQGAVQLLLAITQAIPQIIPPLVAAIPTIVMAVIDALVTAIPQLLDGAVQFLLAIIDAIPEVINALIPQVPTIVTAVIEGLISCMPALLDGALQLLNAIIDAIPLLIQALIPQIPTIVNTVVTQLTAMAPTLLAAAVKLFWEIIKAIPKIVAALFQNLPQILKAITSVLGAAPRLVWNILKNVISRVVEWAGNMAAKGRDAAKRLLDSVVNGIKSLPQKVMTVGKNLVTGLWNGIKNKLTWLKNKIKSFASSALGAIKDFFGVNSPSRETMWIGEMLDEGLAKGVTDAAGQPIKAMQRVSGGILDAANGGIGFERQLTTPRVAAASYATGASGFDALAAKLDGIYERLGRLQIVLDTGTLVGETLDKIDAGLATNQLLRARGV